MAARPKRRIWKLRLVKAAKLVESAIEFGDVHRDIACLSRDTPLAATSDGPGATLPRMLNMESLTTMIGRIRNVSVRKARSAIRSLRSVGPTVLIRELCRSHVYLPWVNFRRLSFDFVRGVDQ